MEGYTCIKSFLYQKSTVDKRSAWDFQSVLLEIKSLLCFIPALQMRSSAWTGGVMSGCIGQLGQDVIERDTCWCDSTQLCLWSIQSKDNLSDSDGLSYPSRRWLWQIAWWQVMHLMDLPECLLLIVQMTCLGMSPSRTLQAHLGFLWLILLGKASEYTSC